jgi:hypothetical protein
MAYTHCVGFHENGSVPQVIGLYNWPLLWLRLFPGADWKTVIECCWLAGSLWAAWAPASRPARVAACVGVSQYAIYLSPILGAVLNTWMLCSVALVFFSMEPGASRLVRQKDLLAFGAAQAIVALTYTMTGVSKILVALHPRSVSLLAPSGLTRMIAWLHFHGHAGSMGLWLIAHPNAGWLGAVATVLVETLALPLALYPRFNRIQGWALIAFHCGVYLGTGISFEEDILLLLLLFVSSPWSLVHLERSGGFISRIGRVRRSGAAKRSA